MTVIDSLDGYYLVQFWMSSAYGVVNVLALIGMIYYEFRIKKRSFDWYNNGMLFLMEACVTLNFVSQVIRILNIGDFFINTWTAYATSFLFDLTITCYLLIMKYRAKTLFMSHDVKSKILNGLTFTGILLLWVSNTVYLVSNIMATTVDGNKETPLSDFLNKQITTNMAGVGGFIVVVVDFFYIVNFQAVLNSSAKAKPQGKMDKLGLRRSNRPKDALLVISRMGIYCSISSLLSLIAFVVGSMMGGLFLPLFATFNITVWLLFVMKLRVDKINFKEKSSVAGSSENQHRFQVPEIKKSPSNVLKSKTNSLNVFSNPIVSNPIESIAGVSTAIDSRLDRETTFMTANGGEKMNIDAI